MHLARAVVVALNDNGERSSRSDVDGVEGGRPRVDPDLGEGAQVYEHVGASRWANAVEGGGGR